jgi:hypothetical protein
LDGAECRSLLGEATIAISAVFCGQETQSQR